MRLVPKKLCSRKIASPPSPKANTAFNIPLRSVRFGLSFMNVLSVIYDFSNFRAHHLHKFFKFLFNGQEHIFVNRKVLFDCRLS